MKLPLLGSCVAFAALLGGCATSYDMRQIRSDQKEIRGMVADLQVGVEKLKRQVTTLEAEADRPWERLSNLGARWLTVDGDRLTLGDRVQLIDDELLTTVPIQI